MRTERIFDDQFPMRNGAPMRGRGMGMKGGFNRI
jgi:hypothetical protein